MNSEHNTMAMERYVIAAANESVQDHISPRKTLLTRLAGHSISPHFGHGQWWVTCFNCGAAWSVVDSEPGWGIGFDFERVSEGDESCVG